jgi:hypothetical protein
MDYTPEPTAAIWCKPIINGWLVYIGETMQGEPVFCPNTPALIAFLQHGITFEGLNHWLFIPDDSSGYGAGHGYEQRMHQMRWSPQETMKTAESYGAHLMA